MKEYVIYSIPLISGIIGWLTNYIAVKMIFRPLKPVNIIGIKIQGLIPKRHYQLAEKIGEIVETHLVSVSDIHRIVGDKNLHDKLIGKLHEQINEFLTVKLAGMFPMLAAFLSQDILNKINDKLSEQIFGMLPELIEEFISHFNSKLDFKEMVKDKIKEFDLLKLENIILSIASKELKAIEIFGGILGVMIGIIQLIIVLI
jgi:uncharacterized membrane protein YheB (UPF0754 family)